MVVRVDGTPAAIVQFGNDWSIGNAAGSAGWKFQLPIPDVAVRIRHTSEGYELDQESRRLLHDGDEVRLGDAVFAFRKPHPWSPSAVLLRQSGPRSIEGTESLILAAGPVIVSSDSDAHLVCEFATESVVLFDNPDQTPKQRQLAWKRLSGPLDANRVNRCPIPGVLETESLRIALSEPT